MNGRQGRIDRLKIAIERTERTIREYEAALELDRMNLEYEEAEDLFERYGVRVGDSIELTEGIQDVILKNNAHSVVSYYWPVGLPVKIKALRLPDDNVIERADGFSIGGIPLALIVAAKEQSS